MSLNQLRRLKSYQTSSKDGPPMEGEEGADNQKNYDEDQLLEEFADSDSKALNEMSPDSTEMSRVLQMKGGKLLDDCTLRSGAKDNYPGESNQHQNLNYLRVDYNDQQQKEETDEDPDEFVDLSNLQNISNLNQLTTFEKGKKRKQVNNLRTREQDEIDVDAIDIDLDEDELERVEQIMINKIDYEQNEDFERVDLHRQHNLLRAGHQARSPNQLEGEGDPVRARNINQILTHNMQDIVVDTPPSDFQFNDHDLQALSNKNGRIDLAEDDNSTAIKDGDFIECGRHQVDFDIQKFKQQHKARQNQMNPQQQMHHELRQLLAQSSSKHLLPESEGENTNVNNSGDGDCADNSTDQQHESMQRWQRQDYIQEQQKAREKELQQQQQEIVFGEQPVESAPSKPQKVELIDEEDDDINDITSPPLVTSKITSLASSGQEHRESSELAQREGGSNEDESSIIMQKINDTKYSSFSPTQQLHPDSKTVALQQLQQAQKPPVPQRHGPPQSEIDELKLKDKQQKKERDIDRHPMDANVEAADQDDNDSFHRLYNKEIKVNQDEIPLLLGELTDIAYKFIQKDQYEKAYVLLQKTESVLEVVNLDHSKRDKYFAYITYHNMAMCFQKLGMLEECIIYLKETIQVIEKKNFFKDISISQRMKHLHMQCQLKLQLCAILSQTQKHTEALEGAKTSVRVVHQILRDLYDLCVFYSNKIKFKEDFASLSLLLMDETDQEEQSMAQKSKENSVDKEDQAAAKKSKKHTKSEINEQVLRKQFIKENSPVKDIPFNILEESISMIERTALKLLPIMKELGNRLAGSNGKKGLQAFHAVAAIDNASLTKDLCDSNIEANLRKKELQNKIKNKKTSNEKGLLVASDDEIDDELQEPKDIKDIDLEIKDKIGEKKQSEKNSVDKSKDEPQADMRSILGFLNQNEWILNLNIGNIMQIQPVRMRDFLYYHRNEHQLSRESFLEKLQLLIVSYFCVSTEMRFIIQSRSGFMKPEVKKDKELEQEYWHVKALDIACSFLPSECPLFNHILLSYQKHHDPSMQPIHEDKEQEDCIAVLRPLKGIENSKYQPLIRELKDVNIEVEDLLMSPLSKCFDQRLMPRKVKTASVNIQTETIEKPESPLMKSQSISVQNDLKPDDEVQQSLNMRTTELDVKKQEGKDMADVFDDKNAYMDLSSSKYQESLISKIIDDPKINDKQQFLSKLISKVQSQDPEKFQKSHANFTYGNNSTYANTQSQNLNVQSNASFFQQKGEYEHRVPKGTLTADPSGNIESFYRAASQGQTLGKKGKNTQSGQLNYTKNRGKINKNFDAMDFKSFDMKSQQANHVRSLYGDKSSNCGATVIGGGVKHHIASQNLAPSHSVFTDHKTLPKSKKGIAMKKQSLQIISHKKNISISGDNSQELFKTNMKQKQTIDHSLIQKNFNSSINSNSMISTKYCEKTKKKQKSTDAKSSHNKQNNQTQDQIKIRNILNGVKSYKMNSNINLQNQTNRQNSKKSGKSQQNVNKLQRSESKEKNRGGLKAGSKTSCTYNDQNANRFTKGYKTSKSSHAPSQKKIQRGVNANDANNQDSLMRELGDVMSSSSNDSNADPDLHPQPESSSHYSDNQKIPFNNQSIQKNYMYQKYQNSYLLNQLHHESLNEQHSDESGGDSMQGDYPNGTVMMTSKINQTNKMQTQPKKNSKMSNNNDPEKESTAEKSTAIQKSRPSSAITNYTSGQSALRGKLVKNKIQDITGNITRSQQNSLMGKQLTKLQRQQNQIENMRHVKAKYAHASGATILPRKKTKVLSRKKYGSDRSSNSPPQDHGYSIAHQPVSIFDSGNTHSISKVSNQEQSKKSIKNVMHQDQPVNIPQYSSNQVSYPHKFFQMGDKHGYDKVGKTTSKNLRQQIQLNQSSTQTQNKLKKSKRQSQNPNTQKQSENILAKLQNLLVNDTDASKRHRNDVQKKVEQRSQHLNTQLQLKKQLGQAQNYQNSVPRKSSKYIPQIEGPSVSRPSRYSQNSKNSHSRMSRISRSKSSGKSAERGAKSAHNERQNLHDQFKMMTRSNPNTSTSQVGMNQSLIVQQQDYLDFENDQIDRGQVIGAGHFQPNKQSTHELKKKRRGSELRNRPKSSMLIESRDQLGNLAKPTKKKRCKKIPKGCHNHSIENLQRQVLENQKILMSNIATMQFQKQKNLNPQNYLTKHSHNNSAHNVTTSPSVRKFISQSMMDQMNQLILHQSMNHSLSNMPFNPQTDGAALNKSQVVKLAPSQTQKHVGAQLRASGVSADNHGESQPCFQHQSNPLATHGPSVSSHQALGLSGHNQNQFQGGQPNNMMVGAITTKSMMNGVTKDMKLAGNVNKNYKNKSGHFNQTNSAQVPQSITVRRDKSRGHKISSKNQNNY